MTVVLKGLEPGLVDRPFGIDDQPVEVEEESMRRSLHQNGGGHEVSQWGTERIFSSPSGGGGERMSHAHDSDHVSSGL